MYDRRRLTAESLAQYSAHEDRRHGPPVFVDDGGKDLEESEQLQVVFSYLMNDFDEVSRRNKGYTDSALTQAHLDSLKQYLQGNISGDKALARLINLANKSSPLISKTHYTGRNDNPEALADPSVVAVPKAKPTPQTPEVNWYDGISSS